MAVELPPVHEWPEAWREKGWNLCLETAPKALRYLADHDRPIGGEQYYNFEHLLQIAGEVEQTMAAFKRDGWVPKTYASAG